MTKLRNTNLTLDGCARCSACQSIKPTKQFYKDCTRTTGLSSRCKPCEAERASMRRAMKRIDKRLMARELKAMARKHPAIKELVMWTGERLAA